MVYNKGIKGILRYKKCSFQAGLAAELHVFAKSLKVQNKNKEEIRDVFARKLSFF